MQIHLDAVGGIAGDMFAAAVLDAFPELERDVIEAVETFLPVRCALLGHNDGVLQGRRFLVEPLEARQPERGDASERPHGSHVHHAHEHGGGEHGPHHVAGEGGDHTHGHRPWSAIRTDLAASDLEPAIRDAAIAIFTQLANAEAAVHGIPADTVAFHEVGAWDSIADIVAAAVLSVRLGAERWSVGAVPLGSGRVATAHGLLPIPAPATTLLLRGFATLDDGIVGERVTPTGAAILRHLVGATPGTNAGAPRVMGRTGIGFGSRRLPGLSNCLRVLVFDETEADAPSAHRELLVVEFEVDDQSAEDLAMGLDRLRDHPDVFDAVQMPVFGKKGRMMTHVRVLARASAAEAAIAGCFRETTTIGLRHHVVAGAALTRDVSTVEVGGRPVRVKTVERPGGRTAKAEADDALAHETHAARAALRREAERLALAGDAPS